MKKHKIGLYFFLLFVIICCAVQLITNIRHVYDSAREILLNENDRHLTDLANSVDLNSARLFKDCRTELEYTVSQAGLENAEISLFFGDVSALRNRINSSLLMQERYVHAMLIRFEDEILFCTDDTPGVSYHLPYDSVTNDVGIAYSSDGEGYIAFYTPSDSGLEYIVLLSPNDFYNEVVVDSIFDHYWILLYEKSSGLLLQNDGQDATYDIVAKDGMNSVGGYSAISGRNDEGADGIYEYSYNDASGTPVNCRVAIIPTASSINDVFSVAISVDSSYVFDPINLLLDRTMMITIAIVAVALFIAIYILINITVKNRMTNRLTILQKEKEVNDHLLAQQKELAHHQRMETIGILTAGIAHEFNNLMTPIMGYSLMILESLSPEQSEVYDETIEIYNASKKAKDLVSRISKLSGKNSTVQTTKKSLDSIALDVVSISTPIQPNNVKLLTELNCEETMDCTEAQIEHAILNLVINAYQAMAEKGGTLTISTGMTEESFWVKVADDGPGIPPEIRSRIFEPFFTTKETGKGTGLGLSIVQQNIQDHGGTITLSENPGGGCIFTIELPRPPQQTETE